VLLVLFVSAGSSHTGEAPEIDEPNTAYSRQWIVLKGFWAARGRPEPQNDRFSIKSLNHPLLHPHAKALELVSGADVWRRLNTGRVRSI